MAHPLAAAQLRGELAHLLQHRVHVRGDVLAVHLQPSVLGRAQRSVQHRAVLCGVDVLAGKHRLDAVFQACLVGQGEQLLCDVSVHQVFGKVDAKPGRVEGVALRALRVRPEQVPQGGAGLFGVEFFQFAPAFGGRDVVHVSLPGGGPGCG